MSFEDEDWEEWDGSSPFWHHCVAGSMAGMTEHSLVYPLDTVRTHIQVCASCPHNLKAVPKEGRVVLSSSTSASSTAIPSMLKQHRVGTLKPSVGNSVTPPTGMLQTIRYLMSEPIVLEGAAASAAPADTPANMKGVSRLFRGVQTMIVGCIPAHACYFSSYEIMKASFQDGGHLPWYGSMIAGACASMSHDCIMTPLDTIKQRMQLGHYKGIGQAMSSMIQKEGFISLYRSFPVTLITNAPYGMIMVSVNEALKEQWTTTCDKPTLSTTLLASSIAGFTASACTTPLDRIKTSLQIQELIPACLPKQKIFTAKISKDCPLGKDSNLVVRNWHEALQKILVEEGSIGLFRGLVPRVLSHTPAVAISWTTYETMKQILSRHFP